MNKETFCKAHNLTEDQFYGREKIEESLYLGSLTSIPEGFNPTVGGFLDLGSLTSIPEGFNPTVGGSLDLRSLKSIPEGFNPTVGGYLDLSSLKSIPEGFNPTVGGSLYLRSLTSIPEGFNPTVGGYLDLRSLTSIPEGFNPTVGGSLDLNSLKGPKPQTHKPSYPLIWPNGKYILADGVFQELISRKGPIFKVRSIGKTAVSYLVTDGAGKFAHGETIKEAKADLIYKIGDRDKSKYEGMTIKTVLTFPKMIEAYRIITGACESGTKGFITSHVGTPKASYTIQEIIDLTSGQYGNEEFKRFFQQTT